MEIQRAFGILEIPQEKNERKIQEAYRRLLVTVNPEDDPEGFKRLREAYETALGFARAPEEEENIQGVDWMENGQAGEFLCRMADVYESLPRRLDAAEWKALTEDPVFQSMDDGEDATWGMFSYLAEHFRLPCRIWRLLDGAFFIEENQQEFKEHLPEGFVDHIIYKIHDDGDGSDFAFAKFKGAPQADYDEFIRLFYELANEADDESPEGLKRTGERLEELESFGIQHPWYDLERAKHLFRIGEREEAKRIAVILLHQDGDDENVSLGCAKIMLDCGHTDMAHELYSAYLNGEKQTGYGVYTSLYRLAGIEAGRENWERARELAVDAKRFQNTDEVQELLNQIDGELITLYLEREATLAKDECVLLGWCFYESGRAEEGVAFLEAHPEIYEDTADCHKQMATLYWEARKANSVLREAEAWRACLKQMLEAEPDREEELHWEEALSWNMESDAARGLYHLEKDEGEDEETVQGHYDRAMSACEHAIRLAPETVGFRMRKVLLLREKKEYQCMVDECEQVLALNDRDFWACVYMQEAYEGLHMAQEVVDLFYRAKAIDATYPDIYLRAMKVFIAYRQYEDALGILEQAEESGIGDDHKLVVEKINIFGRLELDEESWRNAVGFSEKTVKRLKEEEASDELMAEAYHNLASLYEDCEGDDREQYIEKMEQCLLRSMELQDNKGARYFLGRYYIEYRREYKKAYEHLKVSEEQGMEFCWMYFYIAFCHEKFSEWDEAIAYYKKVMEADPEFSDALWRIGWLYRNKFNRTEQEEYAKLALHYIDLQVEKFEDRQHNAHRWRARIYRALGDHDRALQEADLELAKEKDCGSWFLKGQILKDVMRYEEAIECYENSIKAEDRYGENDESCWDDIRQCFKKLNRLEDGIAYFEKALEGELTDDIRNTCLGDISDLEAQAGNYDRALYWLEKEYGSIVFDRRYGENWENEADRIEDVMDIWQDFQSVPTEELREKLEGLSVLAEEAYQDEAGVLEERALMCHNVGERFYFAGDCQRAAVYLEKAYGLAEKADEYGHWKGLYVYLMKSYYWLGDLEKARQHGDKYRRELEKTYEECSDLGLSMEELMTNPRCVARANIYELIRWAYYTGRGEKAREYQKLLCGREMCYWCSAPDCSELWETQGLLEYLDGHLEEALRCFEKANETVWLGGNKEAHFVIRKIREEMKDAENSYSCGHVAYMPEVPLIVE